MAVSDKFRGLRDRLFQQAALRGGFAPRALLQDVLDPEDVKDILLRSRLLSALREACTIEREDSSVDKSAETDYQTSEFWLMRPAPRRKELGDYVRTEDAPDTEIGDALRGTGGFAAERLRAMIDDPSDLSELSQTVTTLERAGPAAPGHAHLMALNGTLNKHRKQRATDELLDGQFVGRADEIDRIRNSLDAPQTSAPLRTVYIEGLPGIGKTFLLAELSRLIRDRPEIVTIRLDFDRSALRVGSTEAIFDETSRQIGYAIPDAARELQRLRLDFAEFQTQIGRPDSETRVPFEMVHHMIGVVEKADKRLLFLLDTLEVLHGHGATVVDRLMEDLDRFADGGGIGLNVISAGRGPVFREGHKRLLDQIPLQRLDDEVAQAILARRGVPVALRSQIAALAEGNPLRLILVAKAVEDDGDLGADEIRTAGNGYLYRAILSRVPSDIRRIAADGLILPRLDRAALTEIVGPALGVDIDETAAGGLLETLERERWLVEAHPSGGLRHRDEVRREILPLTYEESPVRTAAINQRAAEFLEKRDPLRKLYHQLQLTRVGEQMPEIDHKLAVQLIGVLMDDLPPKAQDAVRQARGERSQTFVSQHEAAGPEPTRHLRRTQRASRAKAGPVWLRVDPTSPTARLAFVDAEAAADQPGAREIADLRVVLEAGDRREASHALKSAFNAPFRPETQAGMVALVHQWRTGHWSMAKAMFDRLDDGILDRELDGDIAFAGRVLLEMWAEFRFDALCNRLQEKSFLELAQSALAQSGRIGLQGGALDFAILTTAGPKGLTESMALGAVAQFMPTAANAWALELQNRAEAMRNEMGMFFGPGLTSPERLAPADAALAIAPLNPYAEPIRALIAEHAAKGGSEILDDIARLRGVLPELAGSCAPAIDGIEAALERVGNRASDVIAVVIGMGLIADWARGYTYFSPIPDLPSLARAAERWQQTTAGLWRYGRNRPSDWSSDRDVDWSVNDRAQRLLHEFDAKAAALRALHIFDDPDGGAAQQTSAVLRKRLARPYEAISGDLRLHERLAHLQKAGLPAVLQAPVAVLAELGVPAGEVFRTPEH